jgi:membrane-anchored protein YejM (alkaline phosphatase superfamily)
VIRNIFSKLTKDNLLQDATVYILADHGELFGENDGWGHGDNIHEELLTVPVLIYDGKLGWYQNLDAATLKDIAPTIVERMGAKVPICWEGKSLHFNPENFAVEVNSAEVCSLPHGILSKKDTIIKLDIMNTEREIERSTIKTKTGWQTLNDNK